MATAIFTEFNCGKMLPDLHTHTGTEFLIRFEVSRCHAATIKNNTKGSQQPLSRGPIVETVNNTDGDAQQNTAVLSRALASVRVYQKHCMQH